MQIQQTVAGRLELEFNLAFSDQACKQQLSNLNELQIRFFRIIISAVVTGPVFDVFAFGRGSSTLRSSISLGVLASYRAQSIIYSKISNFHMIGLSCFFHAYVSSLATLVLLFFVMIAQITAVCQRMRSGDRCFTLKLEHQKRRRFGELTSLSLSL